MAQGTLASSSLEPQLLAGLAALGIAVPDGAPAKLLAYLDMLEYWNRTFNLTAVRDVKAMLPHHLLDSLSVIPFLEKSVTTGRRLRIADVGSGAGLPGIPLAIVRPDWAITSVEAVEKKAAFQRQVLIELGLANVTVAGQRVELMPPASMDLVIARAFASMAEFISLSGHLIDESGVLCAMKGLTPTGEMDKLPPGWSVSAMESLTVPGLDAQRHVLLMRKT